MGDKVFFPNSTQFDKMNENLEMIARAVGSLVDVSAWEGVRRAVKVGNAPNLFPIGTQLVVHHDVYGDMLYDVVAHDYFKSVHDDKAHTMTLMSRDLLPIMQFDGHEAFYYAETELPAGTYNFTLPKATGMWEQGTYQFTLTEPLPKGGQLMLNGYDDEPIIGNVTIDVYASGSATSATYTCQINLGSGGTNLGNFGAELNDFSRSVYGSNNYKESAIRQFLNSSAEVGKVWTPQTKFDRPPSWRNSIAGFVRGLDNSFLSVVGEVIVPCSANNVYESPDSTVVKGSTYTVHDKFYLASQKEIFGASSNTVEDGSALFPYYERAANADRIKYRASDGGASNWWTRTPHASTTHLSSDVNSKGSINSDGVIALLCPAVTCTIV